jgi:oleandomycin transport system ATP-binding protein
MTNAIEASGLVKRFGKTTALAGVDLVARPGTVLGVLGPNGAGKTTAVRILATLLKPDGGQARVCGYDVGRQAHQVRQLTQEIMGVRYRRAGGNGRRKARKPVESA